MSCNGCRVLRKGCSDTCILRPCLQWIEPAEAQGHATVFVAKFFGRAGLMGFIGAVPESQRPALFQSLLYEACGRTVNPVYGSVGLLWTGNWHVCQAAVDTVLKGGTLHPCTSLPGGTSAMQCLPGMHAPSIQTMNLAAVSEGIALHLPSSPSLSVTRSGEAPKSENSLDEPHNCTLDWSVIYADRGKRCRSTEPESIADCPGQQHQHYFTPPCNFPSSTNQTSLWAPQSGVLQANAPNDIEQCQRAVGQLITPVPVRARPCTVATDTSVCGPTFSSRDQVSPYSDSMKLDLTLNSNPVPSQRIRLFNGQVSSPNPTMSVNSEGSVTSLDTADLSICRLPLRSPSSREEHKLLDLLV